MRRTAAIIAELQLFAVPYGFSQIPVYSYMENDLFMDDIKSSSCKYVSELYKERVKMDSSYANFTYLRDELRSTY